MPSFSKDIRPLFRDADIQAMKDSFDLGHYESVRAHAEEIYERVDDGSMPCDLEWPQDRIALLRAWIDQGCPG